MVKTYTMEEELELVKGSPYELIGVPEQTFDLCVAAAKAHKAEGYDPSEIMKYVDPELRKMALLKACGVKYKGEDAEFAYLDDPNLVPPINNEYTTIYICGKCDPQIIESAQKAFRRAIDSCSSSWEEVWTKNQLKAESYHLEFSPDKKYFTMELDFYKETDIESCFSRRLPNYSIMGQRHEWVVDEFCDRVAFSALELFIYSENSRQRGDSCEYFITKMDYPDWWVEHEAWEFLVDDYKVASDVQRARLQWIERRLALWLVEGSQDSTAIAEAKKELVQAEKSAKEIEEKLRENRENYYHSSVPLDVAEVVVQGPEATEVVKTPEFWLAAVQQDGFALHNVPDASKAAELCLASVEKDGWTLQFAPNALKTLELSLAAVQQDSGAIKFVPKALVNQVREQVKSGSKKATAKSKPAASKAASKPAAKATPKKVAAKPAVVKKPAAAKKPAPAKPAPKGKKK
jgi:hypothetical protein